MQENFPDWKDYKSNHDHLASVSLEAYRAKKQRAEATAKANARRGALITALLIGAGALCGYVLHREQELQQLERNVYHLR
jgi:hypothetical protein